MSPHSAVGCRATSRCENNGMTRSGDGTVESSALVGNGEHDRTVATPAHLAPQNCFVCGATTHADTDRTFLSNTTAHAEAREHDRQTVHRYPGGETSPAAAYVAQHRPY